MKEIFKDIAGYEGIYEISNFGRVRTKEGKTTNSVRHGIKRWKQRYLKDKTPNGRDVRVTLWKDKKPKSFLVHRLVAQAFIPMIYGKHDINHKDGNAKNNQVDNLEWCNKSENNKHAFENSLITTQKPVNLVEIDSGKKYSFISLASASKFLQRNTGYLSGRIKSEKETATNKNGSKFKIVF